MWKAFLLEWINSQQTILDKIFGLALILLSHLLTISELDSILILDVSSTKKLCSSQVHMAIRLIPKSSYPSKLLAIQTFQTLKKLLIWSNNNIFLIIHKIQFLGQSIFFRIYFLKYLHLYLIFSVINKSFLKASILIDIPNMKSSKNLFNFIVSV